MGADGRAGGGWVADVVRRDGVACLACPLAGDEVEGRSEGEGEEE